MLLNKKKKTNQVILFPGHKKKTLKDVADLLLKLLSAPMKFGAETT